MGVARRLLVLSALTAPPGLYIYSTVRRLEREYPELDPKSTSTEAFRTSSHPMQFHTPHVDVYGARVPAKLLTSLCSMDGHTLSKEEAWARFFLQSPILQSESKLVGLLTGIPSDFGEKGFYEGQTLLNGICEVTRAPQKGTVLAQPAPLLVQWEFPAKGVALYRTAATQYRFPYRMMSGGRHEFGVGNVDSEGMVEVRFSSAHDYELIPEEGNEQKVQPQIMGTLHRAFARCVLDERVKALQKELESKATHT